ncbi:uncharacterized protein ACHE_60863A [Aspergillus chevalieri]|uniref:Uncharacterized protein n=1 Tax=Aspergillus chevalieri TaxID=182096 RepID=A0A7R7ZS33_ASPCH|nr:uncharacterized protein ACHE_60863A [Aspergillus chevalieri]BCR90977.1 hypothetical protein ACHE_60863A [Aspergillus chevalieri]
MKAPTSATTSDGDLPCIASEYMDALLDLLQREELVQETMRRPYHRYRRSYRQEIATVRDDIG